MNCAERVAGHVNGETVVAAGLFQRRGTAAAIGDEGGLPSGADPEREAPGFPSNTILAVTDAPALYAFHRDPRSLDPNFTDWHPDDMDTWDERIVMVADDEDFLDWQRDWLAENGRG